MYEKKKQSSKRQRRKGVTGVYRGGNEGVKALTSRFKQDTFSRLNDAADSEFTVGVAFLEVVAVAISAAAALAFIWWCLSWHCLLC